MSDELTLSEIEIRPMSSSDGHQRNYSVDDDDDMERAVLHSSGASSPYSPTSFLRNSVDSAIKRDEEAKRTICARLKQKLPFLCVAMVIIIIILVIAIPSPSSPSEEAIPSIPYSPPVCISNVASNSTATQGTFVFGTPRPDELTPPNTLIAYIGDVTIPAKNEYTRQLYEMIKQEGAEAIVISGDLDYFTSPLLYDEQLSDVFGLNFTVFSVVGNHDEPAFPRYSEVIAARWCRAGITTCVGEAGKQHTCTYKGIVISQVSPGMFNTSSANVSAYLTQNLNAYPSRWQVCSWHKNQQKMQTGSKANETGFGPYEACREQGAMIATGHEHSYARTYVMNDIANQVIDTSNGNTANFLSLAPATPTSPGRTFVFCQGLGGFSVRTDALCTTASPCPWFASMVNADTDPDIKAAALFCRYHVNNDPNRAECYMKDSYGTQHDAFTIDVSNKAV